MLTVKKGLDPLGILSKMASSNTISNRETASNRKSLTIAEIIQEYFVDHDSNYAESETEISSSEVVHMAWMMNFHQHFNKIAIAEELQKSEEVFQEHLLLTKDHKKEKKKRKPLEGKWKREDSLPTIKELTVKSVIHAELPEDPVPIDFLDIFLEDGFYNYLTPQTNLCAAQYL